MAKLISLKQQEGHDARATAYIKAYMLFPAGILGLISMIGGVGGLGYQLIATDTYPWWTFLHSSGLLLLGGVIALVLGFGALRYVGSEDAGVGHSAPEPTGIEGTWASEVRSNAHELDPVRLHIAADGTGTMTRGGCSGTLASTTIRSVGRASARQQRPKSA